MTTQFATVCSDLACSLFILSCVETSLSAKVDLSVESNDKVFYLFYVEYDKFAQTLQMGVVIFIALYAFDTF